jgi:TonB family protein
MLTRKMSLKVFFVVLPLLSTLPWARGQEKPAAVPATVAAPVVKPTELPMPKDAAGILALASQTNGLGAPGLQPWHLTAKYDAFTRDGKPDGSGTYEVFWAGPKKYKQIFTSASFTQTEYVTEKGIFRTGNPDAVPYPQQFLVEQILHPMPTQAEIDEANPERRDQDFGKVKLVCVMLSQKIVRLAYAPLGVFPTYCFAPDMPLLRFGTFSGGIDVFFNKPAMFQGRFLAKQIIVKDKNTPLINIEVDDAKGVAKFGDAFFIPPADAVEPHDSVKQVGPSVMAGYLIKQPQPVYPEAAQRNHVDGSVVLRAIIGKDGRIHRLKILSSPDPQLSIASLVAVQQWEFKPYLLNGEPVEVDTQIIVNFRLKP